MAATARPAPQRTEEEIWGLALQRLRERAGLSQEDAARAIDTSRQNWQRYEAGERQLILKREKRELFAQAVGATLADLDDEYGRVVGLPEGVRDRWPGSPNDRPQGLVYLRTRAKVTDTGEVRYAESETPSQLDMRWLFSDAAGFLRLAADLPGIAAAGQVAAYHTETAPRRGQGCVIQTRAGELIAGVYVLRGPAGVKIRQEDGETTISNDQVAGVHAIRLVVD